jgi:hypothetical protein
LFDGLIDVQIISFKTKRASDGIHFFNTKQNAIKNYQYYNLESNSFLQKNNAGFYTCIIISSENQLYCLEIY